MKKKLSGDWRNLSTEKFIAHITLKMSWVTCVKLKTGLSDVAHFT